MLTATMRAKRMCGKAAEIIYHLLPLVLGLRLCIRCSTISWHLPAGRLGRDLCTRAHERRAIDAPNGRHSQRAQSTGSRFHFSRDWGPMCTPGAHCVSGKRTLFTRAKAPTSYYEAFPRV